MLFRIFSAPPPPPNQAWILLAIYIAFPAFMVLASIYELLQASSFAKKGNPAASLAPGMRVRALTTIITIVAVVLVAPFTQR